MNHELNGRMQIELENSDLVWKVENSWFVAQTEFQVRLRCQEIKKELDV